MSQRYIGGLIYNPPGGFSGYFDGSGDYLTLSSNASMDFGTGAFTIECWVQSSVFSVSASASRTIIGNSGNSYTMQLYIETGAGKVVFGNTGSTNLQGTSTVADGNWHHVVVSRSGTGANQTALFVDGVRQAVGTNSQNYTSGTIYIGAFDTANGFWNGYISNLRIVKGAAVYDPTQTTLTVPVGQLQAITSTALLTCAYSTFRDGSTNAYTVTTNGNTAVSTQNPFPQTQLPNPALGNQGNGVYSMSQYQALRSQNLWPAIDPYFDFVTLMLHGNGTNGAQNNTFLDSSTNNFTITRNGNTTQGTFTPYGANWSNYFDGSTAWLNSAASASLALSGNFTVEFWLYYTGTATNLTPGILTDSGTGAISTFELNNGSTYLQIAGISATNTVNRTTLTGGAIGPNQWYHLAFVRNSNVITAYINGVAVSTTMTNSVTTGQLVQVGNGRSASPSVSFLGYLSNYRIVSSAVYTSNFTPSTAPLTAITGTQMLTCQGNRFVDNSSNALTFTVNGSPSVQRFSPFNPTTPYAAGTIGGSGYFDGVGDYLNCGSNAALRPGTSDYTIEMWVYLPTFSTDMYLITQDFNNAGGSFGNFLFYADNTTGTCKFFSSTTGSSWNVINALNMGTLRTNEWTHFAVARQSGTVRTFRNGDLIASTSDGSADLSNTGNLLIATYGANIDTNAYMSGIRLQKGTAQYTASFTCPTAPPTAITNTSLLLNFTNGGIIDNAMMNDLETVGNAQISTSVSKFGGGSLAFDGSGDYLALANVLNTNLGSGPFTIELWAYFNSASGTQFILSNYQNSTIGYGLGLSSGVISFWATGDTPDISSGLTPTTGVWYHIAVSGQSGSIKMFINGTQYGSTFTGTPALDSTATLRIGDGQGAASPQAFNGYIDDLRITKGYARYTANFTPQRSQWQDQ